jgi:predicted acylesterase/phospholipase RssA
MAGDYKKNETRSPPRRGEYDPYTLPDFADDFITQADLDAFANALAAPEAAPAAVTALNDWRPVYQKVRRKSRSRRKPSKRSTDETREGFVYTILKYPLLSLVFGWIVFLFIAYNITRLYIYAYEHFVSWTGQREKLRRGLQSAQNYDEWVDRAKQLDTFLGTDSWKTQSEYAYYDYRTVRRVAAQLADLNSKAEAEAEARGESNGIGGLNPVEELKSLLENCIKHNFVGVENPRLYSETYYGTKELVQDFIDKVHQGLKTVLHSTKLTEADKAAFFKHLELNYGRTALCLSGGATFAYYHFGVVKALIDTDHLPEIITGTSGGAVVAALVATRTDAELKQLLVPALAYRIRACAEGFPAWTLRWWRTGARFDSIDWARQCSWFCRGSLTFREAYERTGRILNVSCVPSDPHSPTILTNYLTSPDCVIWSAVLASAAVPGILNPVVLMRKTRDGTLTPYSFGHKWKDGSLRTDIPLKALNLHFNVSFSIVSQVNPHINLFFFAPRGSPGRPVTHRRGRGWRGGFLGSTIETSIKLDLQKYLKILRHLELLPRPLGQDWSEIWLQRFNGTITIWPKSVLSDFWNILSDPSPARLGRMLLVGQCSCWPRIKFISNRLKIERVILEGLRRNSDHNGIEKATLPAEGSLVVEPLANETRERANGRKVQMRNLTRERRDSFSPVGLRRQSSLVEEVRRQSAVFFDDVETEVEETGMTTDEEDDVVLDGEEHGTRDQASLTS